jgi:hypothetical protein
MKRAFPKKFSDGLRKKGYAEGGDVPPPIDPADPAPPKRPPPPISYPPKSRRPPANPNPFYAKGGPVRKR